jgi:hypothetical protein
MKITKTILIICMITISHLNASRIVKIIGGQFVAGLLSEFIIFDQLSLSHKLAVITSAGAGYVTAPYFNQEQLQINSSLSISSVAESAQTRETSKLSFNANADLTPNNISPHFSAKLRTTLMNVGAFCAGRVQAQLLLEGIPHIIKNPQDALILAGASTASLIISLISARSKQDENPAVKK